MLRTYSTGSNPPTMAPRSGRRTRYPPAVPSKAEMIRAKATGASGPSSRSTPSNAAIPTTTTIVVRSRSWNGRLFRPLPNRAFILISITRKLAPGKAGGRHACFGDQFFAFVSQVGRGGNPQDSVTLETMMPTAAELRSSYALWRLPVPDESRRKHGHWPGRYLVRSSCDPTLGLSVICRIICVDLCASVANNSLFLAHSSPPDLHPSADQSSLRLLPCGSVSSVVDRFSIS